LLISFSATTKWRSVDTFACILKKRPLKQRTNQPFKEGESVIHKLSTGYPQVIHNYQRKKICNRSRDKPNFKTKLSTKKPPPIIIKLYIILLRIIIIGGRGDLKNKDQSNAHLLFMDCFSQKPSCMRMGTE
jgi:hypothetical protein